MNKNVVSVLLISNGNVAVLQCSTLVYTATRLTHIGLPLYGGHYSVGFGTVQ
jgi:hypothetical protein